jgi:hypothetical protein
VFAIKRSSKAQVIYALTNISSQESSVSLSAENISELMVDLFTGDATQPDSITLKPYQFMWLTTDRSS